jgi:hypothetical protein
MEAVALAAREPGRDTARALRAQGNGEEEIDEAIDRILGEQ